MNAKFWMTAAAALCLGMTAFACGGDEKDDENNDPEIVADAGTDVVADSGSQNQDETPADAGNDEEVPVVLEKGDLKISQIYLCGYGAGNGNDSAADGEFIEFYNAGTTDIDVGEYTFIYGGKNGSIAASHSFYDDCINNKCIVKPGEYFVFKTDKCNHLVENAIQVNANVSMGNNKNMNIGSNGMYAMVRGGLPGSDTSCEQLKAIVDDLVGLGSQKNCWEGSGAASGLNDTNTGIDSYQRKEAGKTDTDDNAADFEVAPVVVR